MTYSSLLFDYRPFTKDGARSPNKRAMPQDLDKSQK